MSVLTRLQHAARAKPRRLGAFGRRYVADLFDPSQPVVAARDVVVNGRAYKQGQQIEAGDIASMKVSRVVQFFEQRRFRHAGTDGSQAAGSQAAGSEAEPMAPPDEVPSVEVDVEPVPPTEVETVPTDSEGAEASASGLPVASARPVGQKSRSQLKKELQPRAQALAREKKISVGKAMDQLLSEAMAAQAHQ
jgi:hypothetical protein